MNRLAGKVACVTGAAMGLGRELSKLYAEEGARVVLCDIRRAEGKRTLAELRGADGHEAIFVDADVASSDDMHRVVASAEEAFGALHVMTANAGILGRGSGKSLVDLSEDEIAEIMNVNFLGVCFAFKSAIPAIQRAGGGALSATASVAAHRGRPELPIYSASKGAVVALVRSLALALAPDIRVNAVSIGSMQTEIRAHAAEAQGIAVDEVTAGAARGSGFLGAAQPRQVAFTHLHLVCEESSFITGQVVVADGGKSIATPMVVVLRWAEVVAAASDPETYGQYRLGAPLGPFSSHAMASCEGDEHRLKRRAARVLVTPERIERAATCARAGLSPLEVMLDLLGLPLEQAPRFAQWFGNESGDPARMLSERELSQEAARRQEASAFLQAEILARMRAPQDDALSEWTAALEAQEPHAVVEYLVQETSFLFFAGSLPVAYALAHLESDVEETLRLHPPVPFLYRIRRADGAAVTLDWAAANDDPERPAGRHLSFGHGTHVPLGAALARAQLLAAFQISDTGSH